VIAVLLGLSIFAPPAQLPAAHGWHVGGARTAVGCPGCVQTDSWAATVPYRDGPNDFPQRTMAVLPSRGIIIKVSRSREPAPPSWMLRRHPLKIGRSAIHSNFEGNTTHGRVSVWLGSTWRAGSLVSVYVYFGSPTPSRATVARAQAELDATKLVPWTR
jgi:hypothetical protein